MLPFAVTIHKFLRAFWSLSDFDQRHKNCSLSRAQVVCSDIMKHRLTYGLLMHRLIRRFFTGNLQTPVVVCCSVYGAATPPIRGLTSAPRGVFTFRNLTRATWCELSVEWLVAPV
jgi:hypothetical protein